ncbi:MAG TPA: PIN domain-containing protein [Gemmatimonadota bacterium]|nr:PIN domain-containing protein [Gemmatimonadota bacterium]
MSVGLVVDTSVWIDFFGGRSIPLLEDSLALGTVVLPPLVVAELVSGARRNSDRAALVDLLDDLPIHETPREHWVRVGELRRRLIEKGHPISTPDAHVAQCALDRDAPLLARDRAFSRIARHTTLRLVRER